MRAIRLDVDRADALLHVTGLVADGQIPQPSFTIVRPETGHAHVVFELTSWVRCDRERAVRLLDAVRGALRDVAGGDAQYTGRFQHNPVNPAYETWGDGRSYSLAELAAHVSARLFRPRRKTRMADDEFAQRGRNCALFTAARLAAYDAVSAYRDRHDEDGFAAAVLADVAARNAALEDPLPAREVRDVAKSIAKWTWANYFARSHRKPPEMTRAEYIGRAAIARQEAREWAANGLGAPEIARRMNRSLRWVYLALRAPTTNTLTTSGTVVSLDSRRVQSPPSVVVRPAAPSALPRRSLPDVLAECRRLAEIRPPP